MKNFKALDYVQVTFTSMVIAFLASIGFSYSFGGGFNWLSALEKVAGTIIAGVYVFGLFESKYIKRPLMTLDGVKIGITILLGFAMISSGVIIGIEDQLANKLLLITIIISFIMAILRPFYSLLMNLMFLLVPLYTGYCDLRTFSQNMILGFGIVIAGVIVKFVFFTQWSTFFKKEKKPTTY
jgi:hypothetical protein